MDKRRTPRSGSRVIDDLTRVIYPTTLKNKTKNDNVCSNFYCKNIYIRTYVHSLKKILSLTIFDTLLVEVRVRNGLRRDFTIVKYDGSRYLFLTTKECSGGCELHLGD